MTAKILRVVSRVCSDKAVEFQWFIRGLINRVRVEYGDGQTEDMTLPPDTANPTLFCEHVFPPGRHTVIFAVYDANNRMMDRHVMSWGQR